MKFTPPSPDLPTLTFFGDSSSKNCRYMVAGGFAVSGNRMNEIEDEIARIRDDGGIRSEFHWSAYRGGARRAAYENLVRYGFDLVNKRQAALHIMVAHFNGDGHGRVDTKDKDTSVNKLYFQLCLHRLAQFYGKSRAIHVRLDAGNDSKEICAMRNQLCAAAYSKYQTRPNCVRSIEAVQSENVGIVQMADVIIGAIAAKLNGVVKKPEKIELADFVLKASGRSGWITETPKQARFLTVWHHTPK